MKERKTFWDKNAGRYDRFMRKDRAAYEEMYKMIRPVVKAKTVLELATGTGLIAKHIVNAAAHIEATDASAEMIAEPSVITTLPSCTFPCRICSACPMRISPLMW